MRRMLLAIIVVAAGCGDGTDGGLSPQDPAPLATTTSTTGPPTTTTTLPTVMETSDSLVVSGSALPRLSAGQDPAVGLVAPALAGMSFDGSEVRIEPSDNFKVVMFLAHWCPHCRDEVADLGPYLATTPPPDNVDLFAVSTGVDENRPHYPPSDWLKPAAWPAPVLVDTADNQAGIAYGLSAYPFWVVLDPDGVVLARTTGSLPLETVEALFDDLAQLEG